MSTWLPPLIVAHPRQAWWLDCSTAGLDEADIDALPWDRVFTDLAAQESGEVVNADEERQVGHTWLRAPESASTMGQAREIGETAEAVRTFAASIRRGERFAPGHLPYTDVIHIGIGGSALGPMLLNDALASDPGVDGPRRGLRLHFIDNTDPDGIARVIATVGDDLATSLVVVVSKSGGTVETRNGLALVDEALEAAGLDLAPRAIAITVEGSLLHRRAVEEKWMATFPVWQWVGGRFSLTSAVGLVPR